MDIGKILLLHDNARPNTSIRSKETIASFEWNTLSHASHSPDLTPSGYHLFGSMKQGLRGKHNKVDEEMENAVKTSLKGQPTHFYEAGIHALVKRWNVILERMEK